MRLPGAEVVIAILATVAALAVHTDDLKFRALALSLRATSLTERPHNEVILRCDQRRCGADLLDYEILIDGRGRLMDARLDGQLGPADLRSTRQAEAALKSLRWPAEPSGQPRITSQMVMFLPPVRIPAREVTFPDYDASSVRITLQRTACFGSCPVYTLSITGDGVVQLERPGRAGQVARDEAKIDPTAVEKLVAAFREANFLAHEDRYDGGIVDLPTHILTLEIGGMRKTVVDDAGQYDGMPDIVRELQDEVDQVAGTSRWIAAKS